MAREILTSWNDYQMAVSQLLALAQREILIYDEDLTELHLESTEHLAAIQSILAKDGLQRLNLYLRNSQPLLNHHPRLCRLLQAWQHHVALHQTGEQIAQLRDCMILIDGCHGLIRFDKNHSRSKLLLNEPAELGPYLERFKDIQNESNIPISLTTLGL